MKVSINWLKELVNLNVSIEKLVELLNLRTIGTKEVTDKFIELDMKGYNRADLLALRGVAYETAAITDSKIKFEEPEVSEYIWVEKSLPKTPVGLEDESLVTIQCVAKIEGLKVGQSSKEWQEKLETSAMRPVNNIVDATNLVMLEYGQPLHAFDGSTVKDDTINVRLAKEGEEITTLDGKLRKLGAQDIVLADTEKALDVAGVMGGIDTEIKDSTDTILLSASLFNPTMVRRTGTRLGLNSEASKRFYHGLTKKRLFQALDAAIRLYEGLGGKLIALNIVGDNGEEIKKIPLTLEKLNGLVGVEFKGTVVEEYLGKLNFEVKRVEVDSWIVTPPYYRLDVSIEEDVIEEVARMYGYEKIEPKELPGEAPASVDQSLFEMIDRTKKGLVELGLTEVQTYSFYSKQVMEALGFNEEFKKILVKVANPISAETEYLRQTLWANLIEAAAKNLKQGIKDLAIFEVGKSYILNLGTPEESWGVAGLLMGGSNNPLAELNQILKSVQEEIGEFGKLTIEPSAPPPVVRHIFHPNRFLDIKYAGKQIGGLSEVHPRVLDKLGIKERVAVFEIGISKLI